MARPLPLEIEIGREVHRVAGELRAVDRKLPTKLRAELRKTAKVGVQTVKSEVKALPSGGKKGGTSAHPHKRRQLRRTVARGVRVRASTKTGMRIITAMPEASESVIPRALDSRTRQGGWRHPVFGNRDVWVSQETGGSWFVEPLGGLQGQINADIRRVLDEAADTVAQAGA